MLGPVSSAGAVDFTRVSQLEQTLVQQQDVLTQARGEIATGLIQVYRALGGGWQIRCTGCELTALPGQGGPGQPAHDPPVERLPAPKPEPPSGLAQPAQGNTP